MGRRRKKFHGILGALCVALLVFAFFAGAAHSAEEPEYDRLDGTGESGKKVHVIEWEGNLEIHVTPSGSLKGLALKIDKKNKSKPVMVIGYRFKDAPKKQIIRRNILTIDLHEGFKAYKDPSADDYDKIIVSNNTLSEQVVAYVLEKPPTQLYPDGHPMLAQQKDEHDATSATRAPANGTGLNVTPERASQAPQDTEASHDDGTIQPYFMKKAIERGERTMMRR